MDSEASASPGFFVLEEAMDSPYDTESICIEPVNVAEDAPRCPRCRAALGLLPWLPPYRVELELYGNELGDFVKTSGYELLISERFAAAFRAEALTGFLDFHPVEVERVRFKRKRNRDRGSVTAPRYFVVSACFGRASVDVVLNCVRIRSPPLARSAGRPALKRSTASCWIQDPGEERMSSVPVACGERSSSRSASSPWSSDTG